MNRRITFGRYVAGNSVIHRLDPRTKILIVVGLLISLFFVYGYAGYAVMSLLVIISCITAGVSVRILLGGMKPVVFLVVLTFFLHLFMTEGQSIFEIGFLHATYEGLHKGLQMSWRLVLLVAVSSVLVLTTSAIQLTDGLESLLGVGKRFGLPSHELAMMMTIALRFVPTLLDETDRIIKSQMARGVDFQKGRLFGRLKNLIPIVVPLFLGAFRHADDLAIAMEARCYRGGVGRTRMNVLEMKGIDYLVMFGVLLVIVLVVVML
jgi:energy-coupling factor transport system permease protein